MAGTGRLFRNLNYLGKNQIRLKPFEIASVQNVNACSTLSRSAYSIQKIGIVRTFHTSARKNAIGPHLWPVIKLVMKGASILTGRSVRLWWKELPGHEKQRFFHLTKKQWKYIIAGLTGTGALTYAYYQSHIEAAPVTGRKRFIAFTDDQLKTIIEFQANEVIEENQGRILPVSHPYYTKLGSIFNRLRDANTDIQGVKDKEWRLIIIEDPKNINAFVLPSGHVFVYTGLINFMSSNDELAIVLGHEMAHAVLKHAAEELSRCQFLDYFVIIIMAALWMVMPGDGIATVFNWFLHRVVHFMIHMPHSRLKETEADKVGLELASKACFDIRSGTVVWTKMEMKQKLSEESLPEWLSTHPLSERRAEFFDHFIPEYTQLRDACKCPPLPVIDPRKGLQDLKDSVDSISAHKQARGNTDRMKISFIKTPYGQATASNLTNSGDGISQTVIKEVEDLVTTEANSSKTNQSSG